MYLCTFLYFQDPNCPDFLPDDVRNLELAWTDTYAKATERLKALKEHLHVWREYKENKAHMMQLIDETETELNKVCTTIQYDDVVWRL